MSEQAPQPQRPRETDPDIQPGDPVILEPGKVTPGKIEMPGPKSGTPLAQVFELQAYRSAAADAAAVEGKAAQDAYFGDRVAELGAEIARSEFEVVSGSRTRIGHATRKRAA